LWAFAGGATFWCIGATWLLPAIILSRGLHASTGRVVALLATTALAWPLLLAVMMLLLPGLVFYVQFFWLLIR
jgi:hypothetical protein